MSATTTEPALDGRRRRGDASRRAILDGATACIGRDGVAALTHRSVAAEAGVPLARVSYHFPTIDDLLLAAATAYLASFDEQLRAMAQRALAGEQTVLEACTDVLHELVTDGARDFLGMVEVRLALHRHGQSVDGSGVVAVIEAFGADPARARSIAAAMFGFAVLAASEPDEIDRDVVRTHVQTVLGGAP